MSANLYDKAIVKRLQEITGDDRIRVISPETSTSFLAEMKSDKVEYPAIVLTRNTIKLGDLRNQFVALKGQTVRINSDNTATKLQLVPMRIDWTIDVYAVDRESCDEIIRELVYFFICHSRFNVEVPYGADVDQNFDVLVGDEIVDNSDLVEFSNTGEHFRETMTIYTENAHMFSTKRQYLTKVVSDVTN